MGPNEQNQHMAELRQKSMLIHTRSSAQKRSAKFGWQTQTLCHKKVEKRLPNSSQKDYDPFLRLSWSFTGQPTALMLHTWGETLHGNVISTVVVT